MAVSVWSHSPRQVHSDSEYLESLTTGQWLRTHLRPLDYEFSSAVPPDQLKVRLSAELATSYHPVRLAHSLIVDDRTLFGEISGDRVTFRLYRGDASLSVGSWLRPRLWGTISATDEGVSMAKLQYPLVAGRSPHPARVFSARFREDATSLRARFFHAERLA